MRNLGRNCIQGLCFDDYFRFYDRVFKIQANHKHEHHIVIIKESVIFMISVYLTLI